MTSGPRLAGAEIARRVVPSVLLHPCLPAAIAVLASPSAARAMHLAEGILPLGWAAFWSAVALPFVAVAAASFRSRARRDPTQRPLVAMVAAAVFALSCMPVPVPTAGTCSHPCGTGFAAILVGPWMAVLVSLVALILQAAFLAHGGFTTLGANVVSMGVAGAFTGFAVYRVAWRLGAPRWAASFAAGLLSDWATYATTSVELAAAFHGDRPFSVALRAIGAAFVPTQLPLGLLEGLLAAGAVTYLARRRPALAAQLDAGRSATP